jgi:hypothetical protein
MPTDCAVPSNRWFTSSPTVLGESREQQSSAPGPREDGGVRDGEQRAPETRRRPRNPHGRYVNPHSQPYNKTVNS